MRPSAESRAAFGSAVTDRRRALNALVEPLGRTVGEDEFTGLCGPIIFRALFGPGRVTRPFIERIVDAWIA